MRSAGKFDDHLRLVRTPSSYVLWSFKLGRDQTAWCALKLGLGIKFKEVPGTTRGQGGRRDDAAVSAARGDAKMGPFTAAELAYLGGERHLARLATVGADGTPHVVPVGWSYNAELGVVDVGGRDLTATKKYRDVARSGRAAIVIDDVLPPWQPRGIEIRGRAEALAGGQPIIRIHPDRIVSWGLE